MDLLDLHPWDVSPKGAVAIQRRLAAQVVREGVPRDVRRIAGADISVDRMAGRGTGAVVVFSYPELEVVEVSVEQAPLTFPYVPGLLSFREIPVLREAFARLAGPIDLLLVDGQGLAHPRRFGLACHLGLLLNVPAIGCGKSRLLGEHDTPGEAAGSRADLRDGGELIGSVLRTRDGVKPLFISIGHRIGLAEVEAWVLRCCRGYRLPEPTRLADKAAGGRAPTVAGASAGER
ncbi:MAG: deoxyribonuclease V [Chloroflexi bacterium]|nr:deoxyribonuclease V [Chloroflexota bacterium]